MPGYSSDILEELRQTSDEALMSEAPPTSGPEPVMSEMPAEPTPLASVQTPQPEDQTAPTETAAPAPAPVRKSTPARTPAPVDNTPIESKDFNRKASTRSLQNDLQSLQNQQLDQTEIAAGGAKAEGLARQAEKYGELNQFQQERREDQVNRLDMNREQKAQFEQRMLSRLDSLSDKMRNPPKDTMGMVMGIIGMAMSANGNAKGAALAQGLGQLMNRKMQQWESGIAADKEEFNNLKTMFEAQNADSESELRQEAQLSSLAVAEFDSALKQIGAEASSAEARATANLARSQLHQKFISHQLDIRARAAAKARQDEMYRVLRSAPDPQTAAALTASMGKEGQSALRDITESDQKAANVDKTAADIVKTRAEATKTLTEAQGGGEVEAGDVPPVGYTQNPKYQGVWKSLEKQTRANFTEGASKIPQLRQDIEDYISLIKKHGTESFGDNKATLQAKHARILAGVKDAAQLGALDNGVIEVVDRMIGDPTAWNMGLGNAWENADTKAAVALKSILDDHASKTRTLGLVPQVGATGATVKPVGEESQAAPSTGADGMVQMVNPGTKQRLAVHPSKVARAQALGFQQE